MQVWEAALTCHAPAGSALLSTKVEVASVVQERPTSRLFPLQVRLAKRLVEQSFADKVFYANSGTEANEAAIKFSRKHARLAGVAMSTFHHPGDA